jgi:hypothetical protein
MVKFIDMTGKTIGRLTILKNKGKLGSGHYLWECLCECGNIKIANGGSLRNGSLTSCGCAKSPQGDKYIDKLRKRLLNNSNEVNGCREWIRKTSFGYGLTNIRNKNIFAHRAAYIAWKGEIPKGMFVCHTCDNRLCINPEHLFLGSSKDNLRDMMKKNRHNFGGHFKTFS